MKLSKRIILLALMSSLFLAACGDEGGFSISKSDETTQPQSTMGEDLKGDKSDNNANSGATGAKDNKDDAKTVDPTDEPSSTGTGIQDDTPAVDLGNQVTTFKFTFIKSSEEQYANVTFEDDPFDKAKYDFCYYTVNDKKLEKCEYRYKEMVDEVETYKIFVGSNESGTYVLKFFNTNNKQYGRTNVDIKFKNAQDSTPYISVAFNLVRVRFISLSFSIQNVFKKIGDFFSNLFNGDRIAL